VRGYAYANSFAHNIEPATSLVFYLMRCSILQRLVTVGVFANSSGNSPRGHVRGPKPLMISEFLVVGPTMQFPHRPIYDYAGSLDQIGFYVSLRCRSSHCFRRLSIATAKIVVGVPGTKLAEKQALFSLTEAWLQAFQQSLR
jgi:hypothetical protein